VEDLLRDLKFLGIVQVHNQQVQLEVLYDIKEELSIMADNAPKIAELNAKFDEIQTTLQDEANEILAAIAAAGTDETTGPALDALNARAAALNTAIEALVEAAPAPEPEPEG
jgi:capsule polysaccharide export protein KpsE/RkpR